MWEIMLQDPSLEVENEASLGMGSGFRVGFLGELHMEVICARL